MRALLAVVLMVTLHVPVIAEAPVVVERAAKPTVLPHATPFPLKTNSRQKCFVEVGPGVTVSYRPVSVAPPKRRSESSIFIECDKADMSPTDALLVCSSCKLDLNNAVATSPRVTVDSENNRLLLTGTEDNPVILTIGTGQKARSVSAKDLTVAINE